MNKNSIYIALTLTLAWCILIESFSISNVLLGLGIAATSVYFSNKSLNLHLISFSFSRLILYPFVLIWQSYLSGLQVARLAISGARVDVVYCKSELKNPGLRVLLAHSITLTPGSIALEVQNSDFTALLIRKKDAPPINTEEATEFLSSAFEKHLIKAD